MTQWLLFAGAASIAAAFAVAIAIWRRRRMARQPAPAFVFADLVGYMTLADARGDDAAPALAREVATSSVLLLRGLERPIAACRVA